MKHRVYLSLGSNLGDRVTTLDSAIIALQKKIGALVKCSSYLSTEPWGFRSDNAFLNAAVIFDTHLAPLPLLHATQSVERDLGRTTKSHNGNYADRIIDIDILFYDNLVFTSPELTIPHPLIPMREFVLRPLAEIAPRKRHPVLQKTVTQLLRSLSSNATADK